MDGFTEDMAARARWARDCNDGRPNPVWSTGERLIIALILDDAGYLEAEGYTKDQAVRRLAGDLAYYGHYPAGAEAWITEVRGAL